MKKTLIAAAIVLASLTGFNVAAQAINTQDSQTKTECRASCDKKDGECKKLKNGENKSGKMADKKGGHKKGGCKQDKALEGLNLTDAQKQQIKDLRAECKTAKEAKKGQKTEMNEEAKKAAREEARKNFDDKIKKILTPDQYKKYEANKAEIKTCKDQNTKKQCKSGKRKA